MVCELLKHPEVDVNAKDKRGDSAFSLASLTAYVKVLHEFLKHKDVDINERFANGETALMRAAISGKPGRGHKGNVRNVLALLPYRKLDVNAKDDNGYTALMLACSRGEMDVVWELLQHDDVDVNVKTGMGWTSLLLAIDQYYEDLQYVKGTHGPDARDVRNLEEIVLELVQHEKIDVNLGQEDGQTALHYASIGGHSRFAFELLKKEKVDVNKRTWSCGNTPLICASSAGHLGIVRMLLRNKNVDVHVKNKAGLTALDVARTPGITKCLEEYIKISQGSKRKRDM